MECLACIGPDSALLLAVLAEPRLGGAQRDAHRWLCLQCGGVQLPSAGVSGQERDCRWCVRDVDELHAEMLDGDGCGPEARVASGICPACGGIELMFIPSK